MKDLETRNVDIMGDKYWNRQEQKGLEEKRYEKVEEENGQKFCITLLILFCGYLFSHKKMPQNTCSVKFIVLRISF